MNRLADEASPYLRQHADNPVDWYPWGPEAFADAAARDCPILLSIGYSACHWCHVMAHESFESPEIAAAMNRDFVCIKVDREERPDVDAIYMEATQAMTGHGGWPMTVFMTPDAEPFHCGTYYPPSSRGGMPGFSELCTAVTDAWVNRRDDLVEQAVKLTEYLQRVPNLQGDGAGPSVSVLGQAETGLIESHDGVLGGFGGAPKFPQSMSIDFLLRQHERTGSVEALQAAIRSLDAMAAGGIYDHLGGGFSRYSVDAKWLVPHFEKMLYDNALLIRPYLHAWQVTGDATYLEVVEQTVDYVCSELQHPDGGWYSAEDADSEGHEGKFYVWTPVELVDVLGPDDATTLAAWYGVTDAGNFEGSNILFRPIGSFTRPADIDAIRLRLFEARRARVRPGLDDKVLTEWNALMLSSLAEAASATGRADWAAAALANAEFLLANLRGDDGRWLRSFQSGVGARHLAYAQDHACLVDAFTRLYELTGSKRWLGEAVTVADALIQLFWSDEQGAFFTTGTDAEALLTRPLDLQDNATPSGQSTAVVALLRLAPLADREDFRERAERVLIALGNTAAEHPLAFANLLIGVELAAGGIDEVVICGDRPDLVEVAQRRFSPNAVLSWGDRLDGPLWEGRTDGNAYVCRNFTCGLPATTAEQLVEQLLASSRG